MNPAEEVVRAAKAMVHEEGDQGDLFAALQETVEALESKRTATMYLGSLKDPDGWQELLYELIPLAPEEKEEWDENHPNEKRRSELSKRFFEFGEYANVELVFDENLNIVGGRLVPLKK
jgi:hypothetical protein